MRLESKIVIHRTPEEVGRFLSDMNRRAIQMALKALKQTLEQSTIADTTA